MPLALSSTSSSVRHALLLMLLPQFCTQRRFPRSSALCQNWCRTVNVQKTATLMNWNVEKMNLVLTWNSHAKIFNISFDDIGTKLSFVIITSMRKSRVFSATYCAIIASLDILFKTVTSQHQHALKCRWMRACQARFFSEIIQRGSEWVVRWLTSKRIEWRQQVHKTLWNK